MTHGCARGAARDTEAAAVAFTAHTNALIVLRSSALQLSERAISSQPRGAGVMDAAHREALDPPAAAACVEPLAQQRLRCTQQQAKAPARQRCSNGSSRLQAVHSRAKTARSPTPWSCTALFVRPSANKHANAESHSCMQPTSDACSMGRALICCRIYRASRRGRRAGTRGAPWSAPTAATTSAC